MELIKLKLIIIILITLVTNSTSQAQSYIIKLDKPESLNELNNYSDKLIIIKPNFQNAITNFQKDKSNKPLTSLQLQKVQVLSNYNIVQVKDGINFDINQLYGKSYIEKIEPNYIYRINQLYTKPNDPLYSKQWALSAINAEKAWEKADGKDIIIGVIDTGIEWEHPDLMNNLWINSKEDINHNGKFDPWPDTVKINGVSGDLNGIDDDGNGYTDDIIGYNFVNQYVTNIGDYKNFDPEPYDENGHGTLVSGVLAAEKNNKLGIVGLANKAKILSARAFDINGNSQSDNVASAIVYAAVNGAKVLNLSFGEPYSAGIIEDAIKFAQSMGCVLVASAGNDGNDNPHYPSDYQGVISVGYTDSKNQRDYFSNYGPRLTMVAPGVKVLTTNYLKEYREASGSSLSAPYVSASAALLLELNPKLNANDIKGILQSTAKDLGSAGWDIFFGAGLLDIGSAVNFPYPTNIEIETPKNEEILNSDISKNIVIKGSVVTPLFDKYTVLIAKGFNPYTFTNIPEKWDTLCISDKSVKSDSICTLDLQKYGDTTYTIRLIVYLKNNNTLEYNTRITKISSSSSLKILTNNVIYPFYNGKKIATINISTNKISSLKVKYFESLNKDLIFQSTDNGIKDYFHTLVLDKLEPGKEYQATIIASAGTLIDTINTNLLIEKVSIPTDKMIRKSYKTSLSYLINKVGDFYKDGKPSYIANDISNGIWQSTKSYQFENNTIKVKDSINDIRIPYGYGDSNGDGLPEVFTRILGSSVLFQANKPGDSPFSKTLFSDTTSGRLYAADMYDFDKDGKEDLLAYSDTAFHVFSYKNNKYELLAQTISDKNYKFFGSSPGSIIGDFDGDGYTELCYGNERGNIFIYKFINNTFQLAFIDTNKTGLSPVWLVSADVDGDGIPELVMGNFGSKLLFDKEESGESVWNFKVMKFQKNQTINTIWSEYFYGVRQGTTPIGVTYRNGLAAGNIDNEIGDEIMIAPFPNFYIFKWDSQNKTMKPFWYYPYCFTNTALIYDFDKNGINEFGFNTGKGTEFFEYQSNVQKPHAPSNFRGWSVNDSTSFLTWINSSDGIIYNITYGQLINNSALLNKNVSTNNDSISITGLQNNTEYLFGVSSYNPGLQIKSSDTVFLSLFVHKQVEAIKYKINQDNSILISFTGKIPESPVDVGYFIMSNIDTKYIPNTVNRINDYELLLTFSNNLYDFIGQLEINSFRDFYNSPIKSKQFNISFPSDSNKQKELILSSLKVLTHKEIILSYSESIDSISSTQISNYILSPIGNILRIESTENENNVLIVLDDKSNIGSLGFDYLISVYNVKNKNGTKEITKGSGNTLGFTLYEDNLDKIFVYPNPINYNETQSIVFAGLPSNADVTIMHLNGNEIKHLKETNGDGGIQWDGTDNSGNIIQTGTYLFKVNYLNRSGEIKESLPRKFVFIR